MDQGLHRVVMAMVMDAVQVALRRNHGIVGAIAIAPMGDGIVARDAVRVDAGVGCRLANGILNGLAEFVQGIAVMLFLSQHRPGEHGRDDQSEDGGGASQKGFVHQAGSPLGLPNAGAVEIIWSSRTRGGCGCGQAKA